MKRKAALILALVLAMGMTYGYAATESAIPISDKAGFVHIQDNLSADYELTADLIFTEADFEKGGVLYNDGAGFLPLGLSLVTDEQGVSYEARPFTGTLQGNGHTIRGLAGSILSQADAVNCAYLGLFACNRGVISDLTVEANWALDVQSVPDTVVYHINGGGIAAVNAGTIEACTVQGALFVQSRGGQVQLGGIAGENRGEIRDCAVKIAPEAETDHGIRAGGLAGYNNGGRISRSYVAGKIGLSAAGLYRYIGALVGWNDGDVKDCYAVAQQEQTLCAGGDQPADCAFVPESTTDRKDSFPALDFDSVWDISKDGPFIHSHNWSARIIVQPTCVQSGAATYTCTVCGKARTGPMAALGHQWETKWTVDRAPTVDKAGEQSHHCTRCDARTDVTAIAKMIDATKRFEDVAKGKWYVGAVNFAVSYGLFEGMDETHFEPNGNMTRAMYITVLGRLAGATVDHKAATKFSDVPANRWYTGYVGWAAASGVVEGMDETHFEPNANVTREQICKMMIEYCRFAGVKLKSVNKAMTFKDADRISGWAKKYVARAQTAGFVEGDNGYFDPKGNATRAQAATIFMNFDRNYACIAR